MDSHRSGTRDSHLTDLCSTGVIQSTYSAASLREALPATAGLTCVCVRVCTYLEEMSLHDHQTETEKTINKAIMQKTKSHEELCFTAFRHGEILH